MKKRIYRMALVLLGVLILCSSLAVPAMASTKTSGPIPAPASDNAPAEQEFLNVGYVSIYFLEEILDEIPYEQFTHIVWQNVWVNSASDPTLRVQDGMPWNQLEKFSEACHENDVKAIACLFGKSDLVGVTGSPALRAQLVQNLTDMVETYDLDGINIDWEGGNDPDIYAAFIKELRESFGPDKSISAIGTWLGPPVNISSEAAEYMDFVTVMTYDYWTMPSYGTLETVAGSMEMWHEAGFPKEQLVMGLPFYCTTGAGTTGWTPYRNIPGAYNAAPDQNTGSGYNFNGRDLLQAKVRWVIENGYGGVFNYELGTDTLNTPTSLSDAVWEAFTSEE